ncbi:cytochrome P450 [Streptomyces sp. NRRL F-2664]|uniref:cytochrome P450 n=1 Tax=Streptomyces sp. NRRL F-2664 TaxID=1463842 RepID=UPI000690E8BB|nr:cytochrome P450 [Streptomyces sp. NRRL F-2664]
MLLHIFWDWNGTLSDDAALMRAGVNAALAAIGRAPVSEAELRARFARPLAALYSRLTDGEQQDRWPDWNAAFIAASQRPGGPELAPDALAAVRRWHAAHRTQSVISRWPSTDLAAQVKRTALPAYLDGIRGAETPQESKADMLRAELRRRSLDPACAVVIGDSDDDVEAAAAAGTRIIVCDVRAFSPISPESLRNGQVPRVASLWAAVGLALAAGDCGASGHTADSKGHFQPPETHRRTQMPASTPVVRSFPFPRTSLVDISPQLDWLRRNEPTSRVRMPTGHEAWLVTRYDDVRLVLDDARFSMLEASEEGAPELMPMVKLYPGLFSLDGAAHARSRQLLAHAMRAVEARAPGAAQARLAESADRLTWSMLSKRPPADLLADFCEPLVTRNACRLLGLAQDQLEEFRTHFRVIIGIGGLSGAEVEQHWEPLKRLVLGVVEARRRTPRDDLVSEVIAQHSRLGGFPESQLVGLMFSLISSLGNTPVTQISYGLATLLRHPAQWDRLVREPRLLDSAAGEILRYGVAFEVEHVRIAKEDVRIGDVAIAKGDAVLTSIAAANRDETRFPDGAVFDIARRTNPHLAFGHGPHVCAGSGLGYAMLSASLRSLTGLAPGLRLAVAEQDLFLRSSGSHSFSLGAVPVRW